MPPVAQYWKRGGTDWSTVGNWQTSTGGAITANVGTLNASMQELDFRLRGDGATNAQRYWHVRGTDSGVQRAVGTMAIDQTADRAISLRVLLQTSTDVVTLDRVLILQY